MFSVWTPGIQGARPKAPGTTGKNRKTRGKWGQLKAWAHLGSTDDRVRWSIQIPRLYKVFASGERPAVKSFGELLRNIFTPLFEATIDPAKHPELHCLLKHVGFIDCVDDESVMDDLTLKEGANTPRSQTTSLAGRVFTPICFPLCCRANSSG